MKDHASLQYSIVAIHTIFVVKKVWEEISFQSSFEAGDIKNVCDMPR